MKSAVSLTTMILLCTVASVHSTDKTVSTEELVLNPTLGTAEFPAGWTVWKPVWAKAACKVQKNAGGGVVVDGAGNPYAIGGLAQEIKEIRGGQAYAIGAACQVRNISSPYHSVAVRIEWTKAGRLIHPAGMLVRGPMLTGEMAKFDDVLVAPKDADGARLSLEVKWPGQGLVLWQKASVRPAQVPEPRKVKIGTVYLRPRNSTPENNLELWGEQIDQAGKVELDIVCLGETITAVGTSAKIEETAAPIPGPVSRKIGDAANNNNIWVVAGLTELDGNVVYNTAVLMDRRGRLVGKYRKVHLPREEWKKGVRPGYEYPVFDTEFGKIAIQICYDWFFPESTAIFALQGAEIVFAPTWGNTLPDKDGKVDGESTFRVRARDNGVYMVPSVYDGNSLVIDPMGRILASSEGKQGVFWAEVDLNKRETLDWVGHWRSIGPRHRMPHTYGTLPKVSR
ncbi:MAG: carbon-nitrogen hydrolase family protein [Phycisphaerales bacterium]|nr:MAG: carbon-nitrogen hydrolase family protein [Phycisphaerales bacterium]